MECSDLARQRSSHPPQIPPLLRTLSSVAFRVDEDSFPLAPSIRERFPNIQQVNCCRAFLHTLPSRSAALHVGVFFSGGPAPGGHNVVLALFEALQEIHPESRLIGFLGGPDGLLRNHFVTLTHESLVPYCNQGGFDLLGSGRTKIETEEQFQKVGEVLQTHALQGLVIIGGDDSNTNGALLAEWLAAKGFTISVIGVPKTIDGDLRSAEIELSFGFDSACRTYSELIGNIERDALSAKKYTHFIKLMGRSASHITLECALSTQPNYALIGEELTVQNRSLKEVVRDLADLIMHRSQRSKEYGVILIPEGMIEFLPDMKQLLLELNGQTLSAASLALLQELPEKICQQLLAGRDSHGNVQLSQVATDELLVALVTQELAARSFSGKFSPVPHFLGYEGRAAFPSLFDAQYSFSLGRLAALAVRDKMTAVIVAIQHLVRPCEEWTFSLQPMVQLMGFEMRNGEQKPVIRKTLVDLHSAPFLRFANQRQNWALSDHYLQPGPMQFFGPSMAIQAPHLLKE